MFQRDLLGLQREMYLVSRYIKKKFDKTLGLRTRQSRIRIPGRTRDFCPLQKINTGCGAHTSLYLVGPAFFSEGKAAYVKVNRLLPCSIEVKNVCGALPPLLLYAFTAWTWTTLPYLYKLLAVLL